MKKRAVAIIPARYGSSRLSGKPLRKIAGKEMILRVVEQVLKAVDRAIVATDDERIYELVCKYNYEAVMTRKDHICGTDRVVEVVEKLALDEEIILNVQGDEPFIHPELIQELVAAFDDSKVEIATPIKAYPLAVSWQELSNPNSPKVVLGEDNRILYFSRSPLPAQRDFPQEEWAKHHTYYKHIGIYAFQREVLLKVARLPASSVEVLECLEQLRWLANGYSIKACLTTYESIGVDTDEDLEKAEAYCLSQKDL